MTTGLMRSRGLSFISSSAPSMRARNRIPISHWVDIRRKVKRCLIFVKGASLVIKSSLL